MAYLGNEFDATNIDPSKPREVIPPAWYTAMIEASDVKPTKKAAEAIKYNADGQDDRLLALTFRVTEGEHKDALIFTNLNIVNSNAIAQEIAERDLSAICHAVGKMRVKDSTELHNRPMLIQVDVEQKEGFNPRNIIKGYKPLEGASSGPAVAAASGAARTAAKPAWSNK